MQALVKTQIKIPQWKQVRNPFTPCYHQSLWAMNMYIQRRGSKTRIMNLKSLHGNRFCSWVEWTTIVNLLYYYLGTCTLHACMMTFDPSLITSAIPMSMMISFYQLRTHRWKSHCEYSQREYWVSAGAEDTQIVHTFGSAFWGSIAACSSQGRSCKDRNDW